MCEIVNPAVNQFLRGLQSIDDPLLAEMEKFAISNNIPIIEREVASFLSFLVKWKNPSSILEIGTAIGYSSLVMKLACPNTSITTIEISEKNAKIAEKYFLESKYYKDDIKIILGDASTVLENIDEKFDFVFIDAAKSHYRDYFDKAEKLLNNDGIIVCDNVLFKGMIADEKYLTTNHRKKTIVRKLYEFIQYLMSNNKFDSTIIPIDDGMSLSRKKF